MGTSARQKLLKYKLARQAADTVTMTAEQRSEIHEQIDTLKKAERVDKDNEFDHMKELKVDLKQSQRDQKKRLLE